MLLTVKLTSLHPEKTEYIHSREDPLLELACKLGNMMNII